MGHLVAPEANGLAAERLRASGLTLRVARAPQMCSPTEELAMLLAWTERSGVAIVVGACYSGQLTVETADWSFVSTLAG